MPDLIYDGPHDGVDVLGRVGVMRGDVVTFTAAEAKTLGPDWVAPKKPATGTKGKES